MEDDRDIRRIAIHEAGHFVIGYRLNLAIDEVSIVPNYEEGSAGHSRRRGDVPMDSLDFYKSCIYYLAGEQAELSYYRDAKEREIGLEERIHQGAASDYKETEEAIKTIGNRNLEIEEARRLAHGLVSDNWTVIWAIAEELQERKRIGGEEASIIIDAIDEGAPWRESLARYRALLGAS